GREKHVGYRMDSGRGRRGARQALADGKGRGFW
ncbi:MAG: hypothetical protein AVDCRST_MAG12-2011, partial [uncultured Rubrobacteraceae bacterium]